MYSKEESQNLRHEFWHKLESKTKRLPGQNGRPIKWIGAKTGIKGLDLRFDVDRERAMVAIEINAATPERQKMLYEKMVACKKIFEDKFGAPLVWDPTYQKSESEVLARVYIETPGNLYDREQWKEMIVFLIDNMRKMEEAFKLVQDYLTLF